MLTDQNAPDKGSLSKRPPSYLPPPKFRPGEMKNRLIVVDTVFHQGAMEQPTAAESRFARWLDTDEQPCVRKSKVGQDWKPLCDGGWLTQVGMLLLSNDEGRFLVVPTPKEEKEMAARILDVAQGETAVARVRPGESLRFEPVDLQGLRLRCQAGVAKYTVTMIPR